MDLANRVVAITGAATGIGKALAERFAAEGARHVAIADLDLAGAQAVAGSIGGSAHQVDVTDEAAVREFVRETEGLAGPIDLFCANAGVLHLDADLASPADTPDPVWRASLDVNLMAHLYAARAVLPAMLERGEGYLLNTVSAAGLLTMVGAAPYAVSKHAAIGLAESLAIAYGDRGVRVSVLCPQAVRTGMTSGQNFGADRDGIMAPEEVAHCVMEGLRAEEFLILPHPKVRDYIRAKASDPDRWLKTMRRARRDYLPVSGSTRPET
jgi:NAD(P)-dependent dehydrogenase (short-subunit alcohol dehydrogenase family)